MANTTVYPYGQGGTLPTGYPIADDLNTDSAQQALSAKQGKVLRERIFVNDIVFWRSSSTTTWTTGNVNQYGSIYSSYANKYVIVTDFPAGVTKIKVSRVTPDSTYNLGVFGSSNGTTYTAMSGFGTSGGTKTYTLGSYTSILFLLWDLPTTARAQQEQITITYESESEVLNECDVVDNLSSNSAVAPLSANQGRVLDGKITALGGTVTYYNPVIRADKPDPTIWDGEDGYYYLYATGNLLSNRMYRSSNLYEWELTGDAPMDDTEALKVATAFGASSLNQTFWAPNVTKVNPTTWNLYLAKPSGGIAILTSNHPTRGYKYIKFISKPSGAGEFIDAEIGFDTDGKLWLYTGGEYSIYRREMTADGLDWADGSSFERCAGLAFNTSGNTNREKTFEGPYLYRRKGYWYLFCSSGLYAQGNYKLRVVRSQTLGGTWVDKSGNNAADGYAETVLVSGSSLTGPGHDAQIFVDKKNKNWILYHAHWSGFESSSARGVCLDEVQWDENGWPYINEGQPSVEHIIPTW